MTFILQFFIDHQCLSRNQVVNWYNNRDLDGYEGFDGVKQLTTPFIKSLWISNNGKFIIENFFVIKKHYFSY